MRKGKPLQHPILKKWTPHTAAGSPPTHIITNQIMNDLIAHAKELIINQIQGAEDEVLSLVQLFILELIVNFRTAQSSFSFLLDGLTLIKRVYSPAKLRDVL